MSDFESFGAVRQAWRDTPRPPAAGAVDRRIRRAQRRVAAERATVTVIPLASVALVIEALRHASNARERTLGAAAILGTLLVWGAFVHVRSRERRLLSASAPDFIAARMRSCRADRRLAIAIWMTLLCESSFLVPWWAGGIALHSKTPFAPIVAWMGWIPAAMVLGLFAWAVRLWKNAGRELRGYATIADSFAEPPDGGATSETVDSSHE